MFKKVLGLRHWNNNVVKIPPPAESGANASDVVVDTPEPYERILCQKILMGSRQSISFVMPSLSPVSSSTLKKNALMNLTNRMIKPEVH